MANGDADSIKTRSDEIDAGVTKLFGGAHITPRPFRHWSTVEDQVQSHRVEQATPGYISPLEEAHQRKGQRP